MQAEFRAPRRRSRVHEDYEAPLPVQRSRYRAELINQHVVVRHPEHIQKIHDQGYFGKGVLSRARPDHSVSDQWERHQDQILPVLSQHRYEELLRWAGTALSAQGLDDEAVNQTLLRLSQPIEMEEATGGEEPGPEGGVSLTAKRRSLWSDVQPEAKRSCRLDPEDQNPDPSSDQNPDPSSDLDSDSTRDPGSDPDSDLDSDSDPGPLVPGPGFVLVVSDNEAGGGVRELRPTPFFLSEYLQLSLEEAFFLVYGLGCLSVYLHQEPLSVIQLWRKFKSLRPDFVSSYAAYHHYRSRGWVPKTGGGAKYGADLMLYRKGPPFYHARQVGQKHAET
ncbi:tRNA-splicing endonuclease subunit Sen2 isoform X2 [Mugil cephalus]|uniref:tRNA-splicing endonuclease subunit Sen2 isoform X2 n=1 Tax=Mugil cephalus TaxID=48193 RepID=UPI001FB6C730|nr:tRNA-splicing endonuclease subunit Sen2 isoform X2 [Mugil cephalus]